MTIKINKRGDATLKLSEEELSTLMIALATGKAALFTDTMPSLERCREWSRKAGQIHDEIQRAQMSTPEYGREVLRDIHDGAY